MGEADDTAALKAAEEFLAAQGYRVLEREYRTKWGKIDLIARDGPILAFVQVQSGKKPERINQEAIARTAAYFLGEHGWWHFICRFDLVKTKPGGVTLIKDAWLRG